MPPWTLETAEKHLNAWLEAELAVTTGQSYRIGSRQLERANISEIRQQVRFWSNEVEKLKIKAKKKGARKVIGVVPRDI